jgi:hypothetical protein
MRFTWPSFLLVERTVTIVPRHRTDPKRSAWSVCMRSTPHPKAGRRQVIVLAILAAAAIGAATWWFGPQHLIVDERVDEALPIPVDSGRGTTPGTTGGLRTGEEISRRT